jgi:hypothetical protein
MSTLSLQHQAREQLNAIALLSHCLKFRNATAAELQQWRGKIDAAAGRLRRLSARGLDRRELLATIWAEARAHRTTPPASTVKALRP